MAYKYPTQENINASAGLGEVFVYANSVTGGVLFRGVLIATFIITAFSIYRFKEDFPMAIAVAGWLTALTSIFYIVAGIIDKWTFGFCLVVSFICTLALFFSRD